ncbi:siderophore-interacting protein [Halomonas halocynthiae]|uniref:siderophore-interacting protein n=1 Tax=Halomonas halocynthiae TaxID=176290 RepID=UPI00041508DB|nr:siderophore-interacting protein [Halomonas halocynthiae]
MGKPMTRELEVLRTAQLSPHMRRITLGGDGLADFPADQESAYIKLIFPRGNGEKPLMRTYTIRHQREREIDVDFVQHHPMGPASRWADNAMPGDRILVGGPGAKKLVQQQADWFLLVGDMTALPALSVNLAALPDEACGHAVIEILHPADKQCLVHPENVQIHWVINAQPNPLGAPLLNKVQSLPWLKGQPGVWAACEFGTMRALRRWLKQAHEVPKSHMYVSSYWKIGQTEDGHKLAKQQDTMAESVS